MILLSLPVMVCLMFGYFISGMLADAAIDIKAHLHEKD